MSEVSPIRDGLITGERKVDSDAVEAVERLLEEVKSGEIIGVVLVVNYYDQVASWTTVGLINSRTIIGTVAEMQGHLVNRRLEHDS